MTLSGQSNRHNNPSPIWENVVDGIEQPPAEIAIDPGAAPSNTTTTTTTATSDRALRASGRFAGDRLRSLSSRYALIGVWLVMAATYAVIMPDKFLSISTAQAIFGSQSALLFLAVAGLCTFIVGEFDLSFASVMGLSATIIPVLAALHHVNLVLSCLIALAAALGCGLVNAFFIVRLRVPSLIVTLGSASFFLGLAELISSSTIVSISSTAFSNIALHNFLGLPLSFYYGLMLCAGFAYVLTWTPIGRHIIFVGANREVARLAGHQRRPGARQQLHRRQPHRWPGRDPSRDDRGWLRPHRLVHLPAPGARRGLPRHRDRDARPVQPHGHVPWHLLPRDRNPRTPAPRIHRLGPRCVLWCGPRARCHRRHPCPHQDPLCLTIAALRAYKTARSLEETCDSSRQRHPRAHG